MKIRCIGSHIVIEDLSTKGTVDVVLDEQLLIHCPSRHNFDSDQAFAYFHAGWAAALADVAQLPGKFSAPPVRCGGVPESTSRQRSMSMIQSELPDEASSRQTTHSFDDSDTRADDMREQLDAWVEDLAKLTNAAQATKQFQEWLDVQSTFHDYSARNTLLIKLQCPEATHVAGYQTWKDEFDRQVQQGEDAIWIWAPIITSKCPECGNSPSYHEQADCEYDETEPAEWSRGLVGFRPTSVFDISQTEGEPLPELDTEVHGDPDGLVAALVDATDKIGVDAQIVEPDDWIHGSAKGVCKRRSPSTTHPVVEVVDRENRADLASTLIHEFAHAVLHFERDPDEEKSKLEVEAEAVAYIVSRHFGLDADNAAFYLAAWDGDAPDTVRDRLDRISRTAAELIDAVES